ncbi:MAG: universal stress protein [Anaerolineae bacterium]|nr:universal stress protein [Anaerolineae bacterium]NUQ03568.1 universal stress protein [Anaerolineae bacterium]
MLKHLLIPLDGSELAYNALEYVPDLIEAGGTVTLITILENPELPVYDFYPMPTAPLMDYEKMFEAAKVRAEEYLAHVAKQLTEKYQFEVITKIETGDPATAIVEAAKKFQVNAIVMCTHGRSGLSRWLFGSVTEKVLMSSVCPVYVIPARKRSLNTQEMKVARQTATVPT